jgi:hypothetical protein
VKSSTVGKFPQVSGPELVAKTEAWITEAASGQIAGKKVDAAAEAYAKQLEILLGEGYTIQPAVAQVTLPASGSSGAAKVVLVPLE